MGEVLTGGLTTLGEVADILSADGLKTELAHNGERWELLVDGPPAEPSAWEPDGKGTLRERIHVLLANTGKYATVEWVTGGYGLVSRHFGGYKGSKQVISTDAQGFMADLRKRFEGQSNG